MNQRTVFVILLVASLVAVAATGGWGRAVAAVAVLAAWWVAQRCDSLLPAGWLFLLMLGWLLTPEPQLWRAALVGLALGCGHFATAAGARAPANGVVWHPAEWRRLAWFGAASAAAMALVWAVVLAPLPSGAMWTIAAIVVIGAAMVLVRRVDVHEPD